MKKSIFLFIMILISGMTFSQTPNESEQIPGNDTVQDDYLTIVFTGFFINTQKAYISINGEEFETRTLTSIGYYNYNEAIKIMKEYNEQGWTLRNSNVSFMEKSDYLFILMSRKKGKPENSSGIH